MLDISKQLDDLMNMYGEAVCVGLINLHYKDNYAGSKKKKYFKTMRHALRYHKTSALVRIIKHHCNRLTKLEKVHKLKDVGKRHSHLLFDSFDEMKNTLGETLMFQLASEAYYHRLESNKSLFDLSREDKLALQALLDREYEKLIELDAEWKSLMTLDSED